MIRTGAQYIESIRDGREVYIDGERVRDVPTHPMLKPLVDIRARIYDMAHEPDTAGVMAYEEDGQKFAVGLKLPHSIFCCRNLLPALPRLLSRGSTIQMT